MVQPRTEYVKARIRETPWSERGTIAHLFELETIAAGETRHRGWAWNAFERAGVIDRHYREYKAIYDEMHPGWEEKERERWREELERRRREWLEGDLRRDGLARERFEESLEAWRAAGGRIDEEPEPPAGPRPIEEVEAWYRERTFEPWRPLWSPGRLA